MRGNSDIIQSLFYSLTISGGAFPSSTPPYTHTHAPDVLGVVPRLIGGTSDAGWAHLRSAIVSKFGTSGPRIYLIGGCDTDQICCECPWGVPARGVPVGCARPAFPLNEVQPLPRQQARVPPARVSPPLS